MAERVTGRRARVQKRIRNNRRGVVLITLVVCLLFAVFFVEGLKMRSQITENDMLRQELADSIEEEKARAEKAEEAREYVESEEYVRDTAESKFGLIDENTLIFKPRK